MLTYTVQHPSNWSPRSGLFDELRREINHALRAPNAAFQATRGVYPPVDLFETEEGYLLTAELPGVAPESVDVSIEGSTVTLSGERKIEYAAGDETAVYRRERQSGTFRRSFELPKEIDSDRAKATHKNGVLELLLPKSAESQPRRIAVSGA